MIGRLTLVVLLTMGLFGQVIYQEPPDTGARCRPRAMHPCHCRLMCVGDGTEGGALDSPTRCQHYCHRLRCACHPEPDEECVK